MTTYGGFSEYAIEKILDHATGKAAWTAPTEANAALFIGDPFGSGSELSAGATGYTRQTITFGSAAFVSPSGSIENSALVDFGVAGSDWGVVTHFAVYDQLNNMIAADLLQAARDIRNNDPVSFPIGTLVIRLDQKEQ